MKRYQEELRSIDYKAMGRHLEKLASMEKLSGSEEAEEAAAYILEELNQAGVSCHMETFAGYMSNPGASSLKLDGKIEIPSRSRAFSGDCRHGIAAELIYDTGSKDRKRAELTSESFLNLVKGKIVVAYGDDERYALLLEKYGAAGWIQIWTSADPLIHEDTISCVWGTPTVDSSLLLLEMPVIGVTLTDGNRILHWMEEQEKAGKKALAEMSAKVDSKVTELCMPVAEIKGDSDDFVLFSCHYDTWYGGAIDNGTANAAAIEIAKVCRRFQDKLKRSVRIIWWAGHSNGRYTGSTWYCDHHFLEMKQHCIAHINADLMGARGGSVIGMHTAGAEGKEYLRESAAMAAPGDQILFGEIGRGADQSFFGLEIPYHIYSRYEVLPEEKLFRTPATGSYQWHTAEDTVEQVDWDIYQKDAALFFLHGWRLLTEESLPFAAEAYFTRFEEEIRSISVNAEPDFSTEEICQAVRDVRDAYFRAVENVDQVKIRNQYIRCVCGRMNRLRLSYGSAYDHDLAITATSPFSRLKMLQGIRKEEMPAKTYLFMQTNFIRQKNRMLDELKNLEQQLSEGQIFRG
ncbi:M28 family peptidase [Ihubacter sp. rT4E-8]|uniref:M28 family peptidase n=1 Tax=Ihubacter sp. rT4E-8 TaxID=3242369 RepID=UPI003CF2243D